MQYAERQQELEQSRFDLVYWKKQFESARAYRLSCGWEDAAIAGNRIRRNDLPLNGMEAAPEWKGKFFKDNWLWKSIKWLVSLQTGSAITPEVKGFDYMESQSKSLLEQEIMLAADRFSLLDESEDCLYDRYYNGFGVVRKNWNTKRLEPMYQTGVPSIEYVSPMHIYFDPGSRTKSKRDMRFMFHVEKWDIDELKRQYPRYAKQIESVETKDRPEAIGLVDVVILQYRKNIEIEKVFVEDQNTGSCKEFLAAEWDEFCQKTMADPAIQAAYAESQSQLSYEEWITSGAFLPEKIVVKGSFESEEPAVFQAIFIEQLNLVLSKPQYVGQHYSYSFLIGYHDPDCAYPFGLAYYMADMVEASVIIMTILMITAVKMHKNEKIIQNESLVNQEQYVKEGYKLGVNPIVDEAWQREHPHTKAVENIPLPEFPQALALLNDHLINAQKTTSGAIDSAIGLSSYSGESGVKVAQLQMASRIYQKEEFDGFRRFLKDQFEWLKDQIVLHRNYPHVIPGLTDDNSIGMVDVATDHSNRLDADSYFVEVIVQENQEILKQIERESMDMLNQRGYVSGLDLMESLDIPNPERKLDNAQEERGDREILNSLRSNPELMQVIQNYVAQIQGQEQAGEAI